MASKFGLPDFLGQPAWVEGLHLPQMDPNAGFLGLGGMFPASNLRLPTFNTGGLRLPSYGTNQSSSYAKLPNYSDAYTQRTTRTATQPTPSRTPAPTTTRTSAPVGTGASAFLASLRPTAEKVSAETGIPVEVLLAIPANETGWGQSIAGGNLYGIKGPGQVSNTWEEVNGQPVNIQDSFRTYGSPEESMRDFAKLVSGGRYANAYSALRAGGSAEDFVRGIHQAGYATDSQWSTKVTSIMSQLRATPPAAAAASGYVFPVQGYSGQIQNHWGEVLGGSDIFAARGTPVIAMRGGRVLESGYNSVGGNAVLVQGDDGNQYYYAHLDSAPAVQVGQTIGAGTYLGPVGDTGDAKGTGTHLHIGIGPSIRLGADKYGGTGGDFDAVTLLRQALGH